MQAQTQFSRTKRCVSQKTKQKTRKIKNRKKTRKAKKQKAKTKTKKKTKSKITRKTKNHSQALKIRWKISLQTLIFCFQLIFFGC